MFTDSNEKKQKSIENFKVSQNKLGEELENLSENLYENSIDKSGYTNKEEEIWRYCVNRWENYDALEGKYAGDKYTENIFEDASSQFGISTSEAEGIWNKVDRAKLSID